MTVISATPLESPGNGTTSILPSQQRLSWERQWLNENKSAFDVIKADTKGNTDQRANLQYLQDQKFALKSIVLDQHMQPNADAALEKSIGRNAIANDAATSVLDSATDVNQSSFDPQTPMLLVSRQEEFTPSAALSADVDKLYRRQELRQSAVWRNGKNVSIAMRLPKELQDDKATLLTLRHWLADAGLKLRSLIVNGQIR